MLTWGAKAWKGGERGIGGEIAVVSCPGGIGLRCWREGWGGLGGVGLRQRVAGAAWLDPCGFAGERQANAQHMEVQAHLWAGMQD